MDIADMDSLVKLLKEVEMFLQSVTPHVQSIKPIDKRRKELLRQVQECHRQISIEPGEYMDMSGYAAADDSFDDSESQSEVMKEEQDIDEEHDNKCKGAWLAEENEGVLPTELEEQLNLTDADPPSASELKAMAVKCGPLQKKERFMFIDQFKRVWVALHGNRLYFYNNDRDNKPQYWLEMTNYRARYSPEAVRDTKKKGACFELVCPGNKTQQIVARTPKDMEQWVSAINHKTLRNEQKHLPDQLHSYTYEVVVDSQINATQCSQQPMQMAHLNIEEDGAIYNDIQDAATDENIYDDAIGNVRDYVDEENIYDDVMCYRNIIKQESKEREDPVMISTNTTDETDSLGSGVPFLSLKNRIQLLNRS